MYKLKLFTSMVGTLAIFIAVSTLALILLSEYIGLGFYTGIILALIFNIAQWLMASKIIETIYKVRPLPKSQTPYIHEVVERLSRKLRLKKPEVMISDTKIPNAFAYGGFGRKKIAVTTGLLKVLDREEVEAVIGHELGHIAHRDVSIMVFLSVLPSVFYLLSRIAFYQMYFSGVGSRDRDSSPVLIMAIGAISLVVYFILNLILLGFSRLREYYADYESAINIDNGPKKLMSALAKISTYGKKFRGSREIASLGSFKALLISDPDTYVLPAYDFERVESILNRKVSLGDRILELFSTHPNIIKRLRKLEELSERKI